MTNKFRNVKLRIQPVRFNLATVKSTKRNFKVRH